MQVTRILKSTSCRCSNGGPSTKKKKTWEPYASRATRIDTPIGASLDSVKPSIALRMKESWRCNVWEVEAQDACLRVGLNGLSAAGRASSKVNAFFLTTASSH